MRASSWLVIGMLMMVSGCSDPGPVACVSTSECAAAHVCRDGFCALSDVDAAPPPDGGPSTCEGAPECAAGEVCLAGGTCCAPSRTCGDACCGDGALCFGNACVVPGAPCRDDRDCGEGAYCEPAIGSGGDVCGAMNGVCLALPPVCGPGVAQPCLVADCEYRPEAGPLDAIPAWHWGEDSAGVQPDAVDVWSTPVVGRLQDDNCDGVIDTLDTPNVVFVSGNTHGALCNSPPATDSCRTGVLRMLDGATGEPRWSLERAAAGSSGFAGTSVALGDVMGGPEMEIVALDGEGHLVIVSSAGAVLATSSDTHPLITQPLFGWGGGIALADVEGDGSVEAAFGATVWTISRAGAIAHRFSGTGGIGSYWLGSASALSYFANVDGDADLELVAGTTVYEPDGAVRWARAEIPDGFTGIADLDGDGDPELVVVTKDVDGSDDPAYVVVLDAATGATVIPQLALPSRSSDATTVTKNGGPPTIADFDGDGRPEIGVAQQNRYYVVDVLTTARPRLSIRWEAETKDQSSAVTGSTVFDFEGDGRAEVVYNDECFLYVLDGETGDIRFSTPTTSFTATEAAAVSDVDGDGHADLLMIANGTTQVGPDVGYGCNIAPWNVASADGRVAWTPPAGDTTYRGLTVFRDRARSWVGTRGIWNQHSYHVTNVCASGDSACPEGSHEGQIPARPLAPWSVDWLNSFRQNVAESGIYDAPDAVVALRVECGSPSRLIVTLRNVGAGRLPAGVTVELEHVGAEGTLGSVRSGVALSPGQATELALDLPSEVSATDDFRAVIRPDPTVFRQCRDDDDASEIATGSCLI